jgi:galactose oxidase-like protein
MQKAANFAPVTPICGLLITVFCTAAILAPANGQTWSPKSPASSPSARNEHALAYDSGHGQVVLFGGTNAANTAFLADTWVWDGANWTQKSPSTSPPGRYFHAMAYDALHRQVVLFGGKGASGLLGDTWVWDGTNWTQKFPTNNPPARAEHAMAYDSLHGQVVLFGGSYIADTWVWDGTNWTQMLPGKSPTSRQDLTMAFDSAHGRVVVFGGYGITGYLSDTWVWDGANWTQKSPGASPPARGGAAMVYDSENEQTFLFGGYGNGSGNFGDTWVWDGNNWTQESVSVSPPAREFLAMAYDSLHGQVFLFGGENNTNSLGDTWVWNCCSFANWGNASPASSPSARQGHTMAYDTVHGQVVLFGGIASDGVTLLSDTWVWDGISWTQQSPSSSPPGRYGHAAVFDAVRGQVVLFGGSGSGGVLNDTWVWDGNNWTQKSPTANPPVRAFQTMAFDSSHGQVVLFGGSGSSGVLADTWVWDGTNWTQKSPSTSPSARDYQAMDFDSLHGLTVLFGGKDSSGNVLADTWVWDGSNWTQKLPSTSPSARFTSAMAYDPAQNQTLLFAGQDVLGNILGDTWIWDGTNWTQTSTSASPVDRYAHAMTYDSAHQQVVLFGGLDSSSSFSDTWLWEGGFTVSPNSGSGTGPQLFTAVYFDTKGASDLQVAYLDFGSLGDAPSNCKVAYVQATNTLDLFNDANTGVVGSVLLGGGGSVSNNQCTVFGGSTPATVLGNNLTVPFTIQFLAGYGGLKTIWGVAQSYSGIQSGFGVFEVLGTWTPAASTPSAVSVTPNSGGGDQVFTAVFSDTGGASDLQAVYLSFGSYFGVANSCTVVYEPGNNLLFLLNDASTGTLGPIVEGQGGYLSNSQCTLQAGSAAATKSGANLTVPFSILFSNHSFAGTKTIFGLAQTYAGVQSAATVLGTWTPNGVPVPSVGSVSPNSGGGTGPQVFTAVYSDTAGAGDLQAVYLDFGSVGEAPLNCMVVYVQGSNQLYLFNDANNGALGPITPGSSNSVSNSQCALSGSGGVVTSSGPNLTVPFSIQFLPGYAGEKQIFALAQSYTGTQSNGGALNDIGTWTPASSTPAAVSVTPNSGSGFGPQVFTAVFSDTGGANDLQVVYLSFGPSFLATNSCNVYYEPGNNSLFLLNDNNTSSATLGEGEGGSVSNSQCTLSGGSTAAIASGTSLTVPFTITFNSNFNSPQTIFGLAQTYAGTQSAIALGSWTP